MIREGGEKGERVKLLFSLQHKGNVHQIDVPLLRKISKAQDATLADLLAKDATAVSVATMLHFVRGEHA